MTFIGTAAWSITRSSAHRFATEGSSLTRYASVFDGVEINSSFYKKHKPETWQRWAASVPDRFRFAVKVSKRVTHELRLKNAEADFDMFLHDVRLLGDRLGPILLQLPPTLTFDEDVASGFFDHVRKVFDGRVVIEPRHRSWADAAASQLLAHHGIVRVVADPAVMEREGEAQGGFLYLRLHGSPKIYYSEYDDERIRVYARLLAQAPADSWCIFDNTASGAALVNALEMLDIMNEDAPARADASNHRKAAAQNL